jgi:hypothetical protein
MTLLHLGIDAEELELSIIPQIEQSFGFRFETYDLVNVRTFGDFCVAVLAKLPIEHSSSCTTMQAFYRVKRALLAHIGAAVIRPDTPLADMLPPGRQRRKIAAALEAELGVKLDLLGMSSSALIGGCVLIFISLASLFYSLPLGGAGISIAAMGLDMASKCGTTLQVETVRDVVEQLTNRHYRYMRLNSAFVNRAEIVKRLQLIFSQEFGLELSVLTPNAIL